MATSKLTPANPSALMTIRALHPSITTLSVPFARFGLVGIGGRATLVRLSSGSVAVFSPVALTPEVRTAVKTLAASGQEQQGAVNGKTDVDDSKAVGYIVAPDMEHHIFVSEWKKAYPDAKIIGPEGLYEKRRKQAANPSKYPNVRDDAFFKVFASDPSGTNNTSEEAHRVDPAFDADFDAQFFGGTPNKELAFLHRPSRTLIQADLMFNLPPTEQYAKVPDADKPRPGFWGLAQLGTLFFHSIGRTDEGAHLTWTRRFYWYGLAGKDREGFNRAIRRVDSWDFENVIPSHGDVMMGDGKERFRRVFAWHLKDKAQ